MINRVFFISDTAFQAGENLPEGDNIYFSVLVNPSAKETLENVYSFIGSTKISQFALTLKIRELPSAESIRFITSFLFLPSYLTIEHRPVVNLSGNSEGLLIKTNVAISGYLSSQGINNFIINNLLNTGDQLMAENYHLLNSSEDLVSHYKKVLQSDHFYNNTVFFYTDSMELIHSTLLSLHQAENDFKQSSPKLYYLTNDTRMLEKEIRGLRRKILYMEAELGNQKNYIDILRSDHSTKELQEYYNKEYEILPLWYKRFGHIIKVIMGKRSFRSLFSNDVKKY